MKNYTVIHSIFPWRIRFIFVDTSDYLADQLFIDEEVKVRFGGEYVKEGCDYINILASCSKKDFPKVEKALGRMNDKMLICGHTDYEEFCNDIISKLESKEKGHE